jgi:hypothetical protein
MGLDKRRNYDKCVDAPKTEHLTLNVLMVRFLDTLSEFLAILLINRWKEKRGLSDVPMILGERI